MAKKSKKVRRSRQSVIVTVNNKHPLPLKPMNQAQSDALEGIEAKSQVFLTGVPGSGKTFLAIIASLNLLQQNRYRKIIIARSNTSFKSEDFGHLPGTLDEKIEPWIVPIKQAINTASNNGNAYAEYVRLGLIETQSLQHIRGTTVRNAILIIDEAQNVPKDVMKSILTRHGKNAKIIFCGDVEQSDIYNSPLLEVAQIAHNKFFDFAHWTNFHIEDCVRSYEAKSWIQEGYFDV